MPFNLAKKIIYAKDGDPSELKGKEYLMLLILASASPDRATDVNKYMYKINQDILAYRLYLEFINLDQMSRWIWKKKEKESTAKLYRLVNDFVEKFSSEVNESTSDFKKDYFKIIFKKSEDIEFVKLMLDYTKADEKMYKAFKVTPPKKQQTLCFDW